MEFPLSPEGKIEVLARALEDLGVANGRLVIEFDFVHLEKGIAAVRPGVSASDVWRASFEVAERAGMADRVTIPFSGHRIGLGLHEEPYITRGSKTVLEENMVFALGPGVYAAGIGGSRPEDMLLVTATGCETLNHSPGDHDLSRAR